MNKKKLWGLLIGSFIIISLFNIFGTQIVTAKPATNVGLISFDAIALDNAVRLEWETGTESGTAGFKLKRGQAGEASNFLLDPETGDDLFILSVGGPTVGSTYDFTDNTAVNNNIYTYILVEVESNGTLIEQADVTITVGVEPTIVVDNGNSTSQPTATPRPPTATATSAAANNATATAVPTNTIAPTVTSSQTQATTQPDATATPVINNQGDTQATAVPDNIKPTETAAVREITSDPDVAVAQAQEEAANAITTDGNEEIAPSDSAQTESYPAPNAIGVNGSNSANRDAASDPVAIGSENNTQQSSDDAYPAPAAQTESQDSTGRAYLWGGFLVALLVFGVAVVGAIFLYTRKTSPGA